MSTCTCASVPAKINTIAAARQTIVSFSEVIRSTNRVHIAQGENSTERTNSTNLGFSCSSTPVAPLILKNQLCPPRLVQAASIRLSAFVISIVEKVPLDALNEVTAAPIAPLSSGGNPIWPRHRFTLSASVPPSPGKVTIEMSAVSLLAPRAVKLAKRMADAGASFQPAGAFHLICAELGAGSAGVPAAADSGSASALQTAPTHFTNSSFCASTSSEFPRIL